jgi:uncharacterized membrane protein YfcA
VIVATILGLGLLIGLSLGALGGGGSILTVPALVYVIGQDARDATTSSLFIVGITGLIGTLGHAGSGRVRWRIGLVFGVTGIAASFAGTAVNRRIDPDVLLLAFAALILIAAAGMLLKASPSTAAPAPHPELVTSGPSGGHPPARSATRVGPPGTDRVKPPPGRRAKWLRAVKVVIAGLLIGFLTGFFGVGGGFVIVPALTLALGLPMAEAVATSLLVIAINSGASLAARAGTAHFDWAVILPFTLAATAGSLAGKKVADRLSGMALTRSFAVLLIAVAVYTGTSSIIALAG